MSTLQTKEPPGCEPKTHWEERCLAMEYALQDLVVIIGAHAPTSQASVIAWCKEWTKQRDAIRSYHRTDKN